ERFIWFVALFVDPVGSLVAYYGESASASGRRARPSLPRRRQPQLRQQPAEPGTLELEASSIHIDQFLDDIQSQSAAGRFLVQPDAAAQHFVHGLFGKTGAVILDADQQLPASGAALARQPHLHPSAGPWAGTVVQIAGH